VASSVVIVADAGKEAGLGHISRSTAVAVALRSIGLETECYAYGVDGPLTRDGVAWLPLPSSEVPAAHVAVIDSYRLSQEAQERMARSSRLVVMHDFGGVPSGAALVVSPAGDGSASSSVLSGFAYAALRRGFWGLPRREVGSVVRRVLVTTGSGQFAALGDKAARAIHTQLPEATVTIVRGPHAPLSSLDGIQVLDAPESLVEPLVETDLVLSAAGQTMLEAAAAGTPCLALPLVENQRRQAARLAELGAVRLVDPSTPENAVVAAAELAGDGKARRALSTAGQNTVDGYGALRVAFAIARLAGEP
jgi:spore coat polysaccharide biosynthesis predicted glycosyltransferase SpsG